MENLKFTLVILLFSFIALSCKDYQVLDVATTPRTNISEISDKEKWTLLGKAFAKAVENVEIREFLKQESLRKFNNDTEVLYQMVKTKKINNSETLEDYLSHFFRQKKSLSTSLMLCHF